MTAARKIEPGTLCLVIRSAAGNAGREVTAIKQVPRGTVIEDSAGRAWMCEEAGWLVEANYPLRTNRGGLVKQGVFPADSLLPLPPLREPDRFEDAMPAGMEAGTGAWFVERMRKLAEAT